MTGHPLVSSSTFEPIYKGKRVKKKFDRISRLYGLINIFGRKPNREGIKFAQIRKGERILEIGIGIGSSLEEMALLNNKIYGIDSSYKMTKVARDRLNRKGIKRANILCANASSLPFSNQKFDLIFCSGLFDLLTEDESLEILKELKRILKPGGRLLVINMTRKGDEVLKFMRILYEWFYSRIFKILGDYCPLSRPINFTDILKRAGFSIKWRRITTILIFPFPVEIVLSSGPSSKTPQMGREGNI